MDTKWDITAIWEITHHSFSIPTYQRGYRWSTSNVRQLVEDIYEKTRVEHLNFKDTTGSDKDNRAQIDIHKTHSRVLHKMIATEDDITSVLTPKKEFEYCIQPLVVAKKADADKPGVYTVIDGQQRLTTLALMLAALKNFVADKDDARISLSYASRPESEAFLKRFYDDPEGALKQNGQNIDYDYMIQAYKMICEQYGQMGKNFQALFHSECALDEYYRYLRFVLLRCVQVIWYDATETAKGFDEQKIFANFNTGKLPLTNAELIKAVFMDPANYGIEAMTSNQVKDRQIVIAEKWDAMETALQEPDFWSFVPHPDQYALSLGEFQHNTTRIDILFEFLAHEYHMDISPTEGYGVFLAVDRWIKEQLSGTSNVRRQTMDSCWNTVQGIYAFLRELYEDRHEPTKSAGKLYNLIGCYVYIKNLQKPGGNGYYISVFDPVTQKAHVPERGLHLNIYNFLRKLSRTPRDQRIKHMCEELHRMVFAAEDVATFIGRQKYNGENGDKISVCLLLYNILRLNQAEGAGSRFQFLPFARLAWQREHIFAQQHEGISSINSEEKERLQREILKELCHGSDGAGGVEALKENSFVRYRNLILRGAEDAMPMRTHDMDDENYLNTNFKILPKSVHAWEHFEQMDSAASVLAEKLDPMLLVDRILQFRSKYPTFSTEIPLPSIVRKILKQECSTPDLNRFKTAVLTKLQKVLKFEASTQLDNMISGADILQTQTPMEYLEAEAQTQNLVENITSAYRGKLRRLLDLTTEDAAEDSANAEKQLEKEQRIRQKLSSPEDLEFTRNAIQLFREEMCRLIDIFFSQEGTYCIEMTDDSMGNMALLCSRDNARISNGSFASKAASIYASSKRGSFIPLETLMVFTGAYAQGDISLREWLPSHRLNYLHEMISTLKTLEGGAL